VSRSAGAAAPVGCRVGLPTRSTMRCCRAPSASACKHGKPLSHKVENIVHILGRSVDLKPLFLADSTCITPFPKPGALLGRNWRRRRLVASHVERGVSRFSRACCCRALAPLGCLTSNSNSGSIACVTLRSGTPRKLAALELPVHIISCEQITVLFSFFTRTLFCYDYTGRVSMCVQCVPIGSSMQ